MEPLIRISELSAAEFETAAIDLFRFQAQNNKVYSEFLHHLGRDVSSVRKVTEIPFLPVSLFRNHRVVTGEWVPQAHFTSSGTTGGATANHYVKDTALYRESFMKGFTHFYGDISEYTLLALLPSYLERDGSSLVYMANTLIKESGSELSGFYLNNYDDLIAVLPRVRESGRKAMLLGVTYALLNLAERYSPDLSDFIVMETGGMKGMRRELVREELHGILNHSFGTDKIHSEYGMTELLSQAYSKGEGRFLTPPWMKVLAGDINDPLALSAAPGSSGTVNIIDLANVWSCAFIATSDLCRLHSDGSFEITGRYDNSDIRGCNLLSV
jgi:phenylacetate-coenzyme A ligase PaaK-like adenylate-forming protein